ncbi:MAG: WbqC family protein [Rikenellaceae bacterium]
MTILPSAYLPSIEYFAHLAQRECIIDQGEHYIKRSERNRTRIMTASGVMMISVNICNANRPRTPMSSIMIDYTKRWQHQHWLAILSAYKSSPFFDHYASYFEPIFSTSYERLVDLNSALINLLIKLIGITRKPEIAAQYVQAEPSDEDLRPKKRDEGTFAHPPYIQVFYDREPFVSNLSILDLLFNEGPNSISILMNSKI